MILLIVITLILFLQISCKEKHFLVKKEMFLHLIHITFKHKLQLIAYLAISIET